MCDYTARHVGADLLGPQGHRPQPVRVRAGRGRAGRRRSRSTRFARRLVEPRARRAARRKGVRADAPAPLGRLARRAAAALALRPSCGAGGAAQRQRRAASRSRATGTAPSCRPASRSTTCAPRSATTWSSRRSATACATSRCRPRFDLVVGTTIAYLVVRTRSRAAHVLDAAAMLPLAVPGLVMAFGYLAISREGRPLVVPEPDCAIRPRCWSSPTRCAGCRSWSDRRRPGFAQITRHARGGRRQPGRRRRVARSRA